MTLKNLSRRSALALLPAAAAAVGAASSPVSAEEPQARVDRLINELEDALKHVHAGQFGARVFPVDNLGQLGSHLFNVAHYNRFDREAFVAHAEKARLAAAKPFDRMKHHYRAFKAAGMEACPQATDWYFIQSIDDEPGTIRFQVVGIIPPAKAVRS